LKLLFSIAASHLGSRRRQTIVSLLGIMLGVGFFLAVSGLMQGSDQDFFKRLIDNSPHITVYDEFRTARPQPAAEFYRDAALEIRAVKPRNEPRGIRQYKSGLEFVSALPGTRAAPVLTGQSILAFSGKDVGVSLSGVVPERMKQVSTLGEQFVAGSLDALTINPNGIIIGAGLAEKLKAGMGDNLTVIAPSGSTRIMKIVGLFRTGNAFYDEGQTFVLLKRAQNLLNRPNAANRIIVQLDEPDRAPAVATLIEAALGYKSQSWQEASRDLMDLVVIRRVILYSVVAAILVVASFGIYNVISTVVLEKTRDIAILKSMGFHAHDIERVFVLEGAVLGSIGSVLGIGVGAALMTALGHVAIKTPFNTEQSYLPISWGWEQFAIASTFAMLSAIGAAYLPARKGAAVRPVDILRGVT
jgi:lipoprotein-releasing system permease protein